MLSELMTSHVTFDFLRGNDPNDEESRDSLRLRQRDRHRLPQCPADQHHVCLSLDLKAAPLKKSGVSRRLARLIPAIKWEECEGPFLRCRSQLEMLDHQLYPCVRAVRSEGSSMFLEDPQRYKNLSRVELRLAQLATAPEDACFPQVRTLKLICN